MTMAECWQEEFGGALVACHDGVEAGSEPWPIHGYLFSPLATGSKSVVFNLLFAKHLRAMPHSQ